MADVNIHELISLLAENTLARQKVSISGDGPPPLYISFGTIPKNVEVLTEEFITPTGRCLIDIGSDDVLYGIEIP